MNRDTECPRLRRNRLARERRARRTSAEREADNAAKRARRAERQEQLTDDQQEAYRGFERQRVADHRAALPLETQEAHREHNRQAHQAARAAVPQVPLARREVEGIAVSIWSVLRMNVVCRDCNARHCLEEQIVGRGSTIANPVYNVLRRWKSRAPAIDTTA